MSVADYSQRAEDHQCLLVLVQPVGNHLRQKTFSRLYDRIVRLNNINIPGQQRSVWLRYKRTYPKENNEWGDFQAHRKVLGIICIGRCHSEQELTEVYKQYDSVRQEYASTLFDCRLIVLGLSSDGTTVSRTMRQDSVSSEGDLIDTRDDNNGNNIINGKTEDKENHNTSLDNSVNNMKIGNQIKDLERTRSDSNGSSGSGAKTHVLFYPNSEDCPNLEDQVREFAASLFWVLESKRLDRSHERLDRLALLVTPFERKDIVGIDTDTRTYRRRCQGRLRKYLGDLSLLAGLPAEALLHYQTALDILRGANDWLWLGAAQEGVCSASVIINYPQSERTTLRRNLSFSVKRGSPSLSDGKLRSSGRTIPNGLDLFDVHTRSALLPDDIFDKYREAILQYSKFKNAGIIELEASIKACKVLIMQQKCMEAAEFLKNVVYINLQLTDDEKMQRYDILATLYSQIGFHRKSAFFRRIAAMQCVAPTVAVPAWSLCYSLLHQTLHGYKLPLDPRDRPNGVIYGWPVVQVRVLHEMIYSARKMGNPAIAIRHLTYLLHTLFDHLTIMERTEVAGVLESYTVKCEGTAQPLALDSGVILPPVPFSRFPTIKSFKPQPLPAHLRPSLISNEPEAKPHSIFIYSPLQLTSQDNMVTPNSKMNFQWVEGDICEIMIQAYNPMPFELRIINMGLLSEGTEFESYPATLSLPADSGPIPIKILGTPHSVGKLTITGYVTHVMGVRSHCRLKDIPDVQETNYSVEVIPAMPQMSVTTSFPTMDTFLSSPDEVTSTATVNMYTGQSKEWVLTLSNTSRLPVQFLEVSLDSALQEGLTDEMFVWNPENIQSQLPIPPGGKASLTVYINALSKLFTGFDYATTTAKSTESLEIQSQVVDAVLTFKYSGGSGYTEGHCRQLGVNVNVHLSQSLAVSRCDVQPAESMRHCHLVFDLHNTTEHGIEVQYGATQILLVPPQITKRVAVQVARYSVDKPLCRDLVQFDGEAWDLSKKSNRLHPSHGKHQSRKLYNPDGSVKSDEEDLSPVEQLYSQLLKHIANYVDIRWKISEDVQGQVTCDSLTWSKEQIEGLCQPPVEWEIKINNNIHESGQLTQCQIGENVDIHVSCVNQSGMVINDVLIVIDCNRDCSQQQGEDQQEQLIILGNQSQTCPEWPPEEVLGHSCQFFMLCSGDFSINVRCTGLIGATSVMETSSSKRYPLDVTHANAYAGSSKENSPVLELHPGKDISAGSHLDSSQYSQISLDTDSEGRTPDTENKDISTSDQNPAESMSPKHQCSLVSPVGGSEHHYGVPSGQKVKDSESGRRIQAAHVKSSALNSPTAAGKKSKKLCWTYEPQIYVEVAEYLVS